MYHAECIESSAAELASDNAKDRLGIRLDAARKHQFPQRHRLPAGRRWVASVPARAVLGLLLDAEHGVV